ncbi:DUF1492 domain-containing protein [Gemmiger sp.]
MQEELGPVYDFLMRPHWKKQEIRRLEETIEELRSCLLPGAIRYDKESVQSSPGNQLEETIAKIDEMERRLKQLNEERARLIVEVNEVIDRLEDPAERSVLTFYYVNRYSPAKVASLIGYSERWMYKTKKSAILKLFSEMQCIGMI